MFGKIMSVKEFVNGVFQTGIVHKPSSQSIVRIVSKDEVVNLMDSQKIESKDNIYLGKSLVYSGFNVLNVVDVL